MRDGVRACHRCRQIFPPPTSAARPPGEPVPESACGAVRFEALFPDRIHFCDLPAGHDDPKKHRQMHAMAGACGAPCCAGLLWTEPDEVDPISALLESICRTLDDIHETLTRADRHNGGPLGPHQLPLFP
jgi:hypothetical protein